MTDLEKYIEEVIEELKVEFELAKASTGKPRSMSEALEEKLRGVYNEGYKQAAQEDGMWPEVHDCDCSD